MPFSSAEKVSAPLGLTPGIAPTGYSHMSSYPHNNVFCYDFAVVRAINQNIAAMCEYATTQSASAME